MFYVFILRHKSTRVLRECGPPPRLSNPPKHEPFHLLKIPGYKSVSGFLPKLNHVTMAKTQKCSRKSVHKFLSNPASKVCIAAWWLTAGTVPSKALKRQFTKLMGDVTTWWVCHLDHDFPFQHFKRFNGHVCIEAKHWPLREWWCWKTMHEQIPAFWPNLELEGINTNYESVVRLHNGWSARYRVGRHTLTMSTHKLPSSHYTPQKNNIVCFFLLLFSMQPNYATFISWTVRVCSRSHAQTDFQVRNHLLKLKADMCLLQEPPPK